jgi:IS5 family transposase
VSALFNPLYPAAKGEPAWPSLAMFRALLLSIWYDLSDMKLAEVLDRASFCRFCGFAASEATPERTAFVRFRKLLVAHKLDRALFEIVTSQLKSKAVKVKTNTLRHVFANGGYAGDKFRSVLVSIGKWTIEIIKRSDKAKGFEVLPRRWVAERTFA